MQSTDLSKLFYYFQNHCVEFLQFRNKYAAYLIPLSSFVFEIFSFEISLSFTVQSLYADR